MNRFLYTLKIAAGYTTNPFTSDSQLCQPEPHLLQEVLGHRWLIHGLHFVHLLLASNNINLGCPDAEGCSLPDLVTKIKRKEDGQCDVGSEEVAHVPVVTDEDLETIGEGEDRNNEERSIGAVRLQGCLVRQLSPKIVKKDGFAEAKIGDHDDNPSKEARNG